MAELENVPKEAMDVNAAVRMVLKKALQHDGLARGLHEAARAVEKGQVRMSTKSLIGALSRAVGAACCIKSMLCML